MSSDMLLNGALINLEPGSQLIDEYAVGIALNQFLHLDWSKAPADPFRGPKGGLIPG